MLLRYCATKIYINARSFHHRNEVTPNRQTLKQFKKMSYQLSQFPAAGAVIIIIIDSSKIVRDQVKIIPKYE